MEKFPVIYATCHSSLQGNYKISEIDQNVEKVIEETADVLAEKFSDYISENNGEIPKFIALSDKIIFDISLRFSTALTKVLQNKLSWCGVRIILYSQFTSASGLVDKIRSECHGYGISNNPSDFGKNGRYLLYEIEKN